MRDVIVFGLIRLALWAVLWWILALAGVGTILAGLLAVLIAMMLSFLFLNRQRDAAAMSWKEADDRRRERKGARRDEDAEAEDALIASQDRDGTAEGPSSEGSDPEEGTDQRTRPTSSSSE